jgi:hypothetical protein
VRRALLLAIVVGLAGCGGGARQTRTQPPPPKLPRALAQSWSTQADAVASALAAGDGCTALHDAEQLRAEVAQTTRQIPARFRAPLTAAVGDLPGRITCTPPAPVTTQESHDNGKGKDHGKHRGKEGDQG